jgi:hypothetical protein
MQKNRIQHFRKVREMDERMHLEKLHIIPYRQGIAEYAAEVRRRILDRKDTDFILAVDLPHGLENEVITATKNLPRTSVIVDQLFRGIPIIPTSAPIEAVRSFQETGVDLKFIDTSLPVTGNLDDYRYFIDQCRLSGVETVIKNAKYYGISPDDLLKSWLDSLMRSDYGNGFCHLTNMAEEMQAVPFSDTRISPYRKTRFQYMAYQLDELLRTGTDVVLVCSVNHVAGIRHFLSGPLQPVDDRFVVPARTCAIGGDDILQLSPEIPYFMYLYELFRDMPVDRQRWILDACSGTEAPTPSPEMVRMVQKYAYNLALTDRELYPDIYNLVASAKYCVTDHYAYELYKLLKSYPPSGTTKSECSLNNISDYNFLPLGSTRYLTLKVSVFRESPAVARIRKKLLRSSTSVGYSRFTRTPLSIQNERDFMKYMTSHFTAHQTSEENYQVHEFVSGFCNGPDIRETIRNRPFNRIYVKEPAVENRACYIVDYRSAAIGRTRTISSPGKKTTTVQESLDTSTRFCSTKIFLDRNYPWVGLAVTADNHYACGVMVVFAGLTKDPIPLMDELSYLRPLESAVNVGLHYAKQVFVFTDSRGEIEGKFPGKKGIRILPTSAIQPDIFAKMQVFDIVCNRYDNRRGD